LIFVPTWRRKMRKQKKEIEKEKEKRMNPMQI